MKKIVTVLLVLIMALSVFTACGKDKSALEKAGEYLYAMYKDDDKSVTPNDFEVVGVVSVDGVKYTVEWTTDNDKIKLVPNETTKMVKVDVDERSETEEKYTLTATIKDEKGKTYTVKFEHTVPQFVVSTVAQVKEMADGTDVVLSGVVVKIDTAWSDSYKNISVTLKDAAGNIEACITEGRSLRLCPPRIAVLYIWPRSSTIRFISIEGTLDSFISLMILHS